MTAKQKLAIGMRTNSGYTLIEILIVIVILGVTLSFALMAFGDFGQRRQIIVNAEEFMTYIQFLQQQAVIENRNFRIQLINNQYQVSRYSGHKTWQMMPEKSIFHPRYFHSKTSVRLHLGTAQSAGIIIYSTGQISPFTLILGKGEQTIATIMGRANGSLSLQVEKS